MGKAVVDGPEVCYRPMVDDVHESAQLNASADGIDHLGAEGAAAEGQDRKSYATKLRMIILLSLVCWAALIAGIIWLVP